MHCLCADCYSKVKASFSMASKTVEAVKMDSEKIVENTDDFVKIKRKSRKRKIQTQPEKETNSMDTSEAAPKRPHLPEISGENLVVSCLHFLIVEIVVQYNNIQS